MSHQLKNGSAPHFSMSPPSNVKHNVKDKYSLFLDLVWLIFVTLPYQVLRVVVKNAFPPAGKSLKGRVALVTGGARGVGRGLALALAREGCTVAVADVNQAGAEATVDEICRLGGVAEAYFANIAKIEEVRALRSAIMRTLGPVDILVNNAALIYGESLEDCTEEAVTGVISVNLFSLFWIAKVFLPTMTSRNHGHIVTISSSCVLAGFANAAYVASKCGVKGFMEVLRSELDARPGNKIKTTTVFPYFINTSADYVKHWDLRFPPLSIHDVVEAVINGIKHDEVIVTVPSYLHFTIQIIRLMPQHVVDEFHRICYTRHIPMSTEFKSQLPTASIIRDLAKEH